MKIHHLSFTLIINNSFFMSDNRYSKTFLLVALLFFFGTPLLKAIEPETLMGLDLNYDKKEITIKVISHGCTQKSNFLFVVKGNMLTVKRIKEDNCKAMGKAVYFTYSFKEARLDGNKEFTVTNKFIANPFLAGIRRPGK